MQEVTTDMHDMVEKAMLEDIPMRSVDEALGSEQFEVKLGSVQAEMPKYKSHKTVWALKIKHVSQTPSVNGLPGNTMITPVEPGYASFEVDAEFMAKHNPQVGGYYVMYADGYKSFSPAEAFEDGYTRI